MELSWTFNNCIICHCFSKLYYKLSELQDFAIAWCIQRFGERVSIGWLCSAREPCDWLAVQCSSTCGPGKQVRAVVCRRTSAVMPPCLPEHRPSDRRTCRARIPCYGTTGNWFGEKSFKFIIIIAIMHFWILKNFKHWSTLAYVIIKH